MSEQGVSQPKGIITKPGVSGVGMAVPMTQPNEQLIETIEKALAHRHTSSLWNETYNADSEVWLRALLEENTGNQQLLGMQKEVIMRLESELQQTREELRFEKVQSSGWNSEYLKATAELEQVKAERDRLEIALHTRKSYDLTVSEMQEDL
jgi:hypothetical protein